MFDLLFLVLTNGLLLNVMAETTLAEQVPGACGVGKMLDSTRQEKANRSDDFRVSVASPETKQGCCVLTECEEGKEKRKVYTSKRSCKLRARRDSCKYTLHTAKRCDQVEERKPGRLRGAPSSTQAFLRSVPDTLSWSRK